LDVTAIFCSVDDFCQRFEGRVVSLSPGDIWKPQVLVCKVQKIQERRTRESSSQFFISHNETALLRRGNRGYIAQKLFEELYQRGLQLVTKARKNMQQHLVKLIDKILLRKQSIVESVNDQLQNICQIEHSRHCSGWNFLVNVLAGLIAYIYQPKLPSLDLRSKGLPALPSSNPSNLH
jgi:hypothetical protein